MRTRIRITPILFLLALGVVFSIAYANTPPVVSPDSETHETYDQSPELTIKSSFAGNSDGTFRTSIPIEVPPYHGLEPKLGLNYSSANGYGFVGVGWSLSGFSAIQRRGSKHAGPTYAVTDEFLLDGNLLVACSRAMSSPGCLAGGTHATEIESYVRISRDSSQNTWTVWQRDGTRAVYEPVWTTEKGVFMWGIREQVDTHGNRVRYDWFQDGTPGAAAYPERIAYNNDRVVIQFWREERPDALPLATGSNFGIMRYRLRTIQVSVNGGLASAYWLVYLADDVLTTTPGRHPTASILLVRVEPKPCCVRG